jgi:hypothetical protein
MPKTDERNLPTGSRYSTIASKQQACGTRDGKHDANLVTLKSMLQSLETSYFGFAAYFRYTATDAHIRFG